MPDCKNQSMFCTTTADSRYYPPNNNPLYERGCMPCIESACKDIHEGEFPFTGPAVVYGVCNIHKSYLIVKADDVCEVKWNALWPNGRTLIDTEGQYKVKYKWDACCEGEPQFAIAPYPCPCTN